MCPRQEHLGDFHFCMQVSSAVVITCKKRGKGRKDTSGYSQELIASSFSANTIQSTSFRATDLVRNLVSCP